MYSFVDIVRLMAPKKALHWNPFLRIEIFFQSFVLDVVAYLSCLFKFWFTNLPFSY